MIGLMALGALGLWLILTIFLSNKIPQWFGIIKHKRAISVLFFPLILVMPIADDLIGMLQFRELCEKEAVVTLSQDWKKVKRAKWVGLPVNYYNQNVIPITIHSNQYIDLDTGRVFLFARSLYTHGGFLRRFINAKPSSCYSENQQILVKQINLNELLRNGEGK